jgi:hypothetical protein
MQLALEEDAQAEPQCQSGRNHAASLAVVSCLCSVTGDRWNYQDSERAAGVPPRSGPYGIARPRRFRMPPVAKRARPGIDTEYTEWAVEPDGFEDIVEFGTDEAAARQYVAEHGGNLLTRTVYVSHWAED